MPFIDDLEVSETNIKAYLIAARSGDVSKCKEMLDLGVPVDVESDRDFDHQMSRGTALHAALTNGHLNVAELLVDHGANVHKTDWRGANVGIEAAKSQTEEAFQALKWLVHRFGTGFSGKQNLTMLHVACYSGQMRSVEMLLKAGCDPNSKSDLLYTPLHYACGRDSGTFMNALLQAGADPHMRSISNLLPLHFLANPETILTAHALGWDLNTPGRRDMTLMQMMDCDKNQDAIRALMALGYSNKQCYGITNAIEEILERSPFVNAIDSRNPDVLMAHLDRFGFPDDDELKSVKTKLTKSPAMKVVFQASMAKQTLMMVAQGKSTGVVP